MTKTTVSLQAINDVKDFVNTVMKYEFDIDLVAVKRFRGYYVMYGFHRSFSAMAEPIS